MKLVQDYLRRAEECRKLAMQSEILDHRKSIERISDTWTRLASERLKFLKNPVSNGGPKISR
jgi:hypothetical protein